MDKWKKIKLCLSVLKIDGSVEYKTNPMVDTLYIGSLKWEGFALL